MDLAMLEEPAVVTPAKVHKSGVEERNLVEKDRIKIKVNDTEVLDYKVPNNMTAHVCIVFRATESPA